MSDTERQQLDRVGDAGRCGLAIYAVDFQVDGRRRIEGGDNEGDQYSRRTREQFGSFHGTILSPISVNVNSFFQLFFPTPGAIAAALAPGNRPAFQGVPQFGVGFHPPEVDEHHECQSTIEQMDANRFPMETPTASGQFRFNDPKATNNPQRFYRVRSH